MLFGVSIALSKPGLQGNAKKRRIDHERRKKLEKDGKDIIHEFAGSKSAHAQKIQKGMGDVALF